jgi:hypothetical protein
MTLDTIGTWIASNQSLAAPLVALLVAWVLYGVLGKRVLGADDDFWPAIRRRLLPRLDALARRYGLYAETEALEREYVGYISATSVDDVERALEDMGYRRNPLASYKTNARGWHSDGSWAKREAALRPLGDRIRGTAGQAPFMLRGGPLSDALGRFFQSLGEILASRQDHVTLFAQRPPGSDGVTVHVYAHREANSLNPVMAYKHYQGSSVDVQAGVHAVRSDLEAYAQESRLVFTTGA